MLCWASYPLLGSSYDTALALHNGRSRFCVVCRYYHIKIGHVNNRVAFLANSRVILQIEGWDCSIAQ